MERMWRKVNQGLSNTTSTVFNKQTTSRNVDSNIGQQARYSIEDDGPVYANVPPNNRGWGYIDTQKCRKRRRKVKGRRNRWVRMQQLIEQQQFTCTVTIHGNPKRCRCATTTLWPYNAIAFPNTGVWVIITTLIWFTTPSSSIIIYRWIGAIRAVGFAAI